MLDGKGICASVDQRVPPVLLIRLMYCWQSDFRMKSRMVLLRLTINEEITKEDIDYVVENLKAIIERLHVTCLRYMRTL